MSTGLECRVYQVDQKWYYALETDRNACDWRDAAQSYGPFPSQDAAEKHLGDNHANPGGLSVYEGMTMAELDETDRALIERAQKPAPTYFIPYGRPRRW